jgi:PCI domain
MSSKIAAGMLNKICAAANNLRNDYSRELSQTLNLTQEEGEKWIVNLIRDTRVDAKIDFEEVCT